MKKKRTVSLQQPQRKRLLRILFCLMAVALGYLTFFGDQSLLSIIKKQRHLERMEKEREELIQENSKLQEDVKQITTNPKFLEEEARKINMLKENEVILDFSGKPTQKEKKK